MRDSTPFRSRTCRPAGWLLALVALLFAPSASACVLGAVSLTPLGDSTALLRIEHDGTAGLRQLRNGSKLVLFIERCRTTAGLHEAPVLAPPVSALRWSDRRENDAVWVDEVTFTPGASPVGARPPPPAYERARRPRKSRRSTRQ